MAAPESSVTVPPALPMTLPAKVSPLPVVVVRVTLLPDTGPLTLSAVLSVRANAPVAVKLPKVETVLEVLLRLTEAALPDSVPATPSNWLWVRPPVIFSVISPLVLSPLVVTLAWDSDPIDRA